MIRIIKVRSRRQTAQTAQLAREIWPEHYVPIIGQPQVDYMLEMFQSEEAIAKQIDGGYNYFIIIRNGQPAGYMALLIEADKASILISKIYVKKQARGHGLGKRMLRIAEELCRKHGLNVIRLTVNKNNSRSIVWYSRMGFAAAGSMVQDIGSGFVMDDFIMQKTVSKTGEGVVLLHGLCRSARSMARMQQALVREGYTVLNPDYDSRSGTVEELSQRVVGGALSDTRLQSCTKIHFITHSLGGILVRFYFSKNSDPRLGRVVMLGPPNQGSEVVDRLRSRRLFRKINGPAGQQLGTGFDSIPVSLGPVNFELGVIAGDGSINRINSLMIAGANDGKVSVERTKTDGMNDHLVLHSPHPFIMKNRRAIAAAKRFLKTGGF